MLGNNRNRPFTDLFSDGLIYFQADYQLAPQTQPKSNPAASSRSHLNPHQY